LTRFTFLASRCSPRFTGGTTKSPILAGVRSMAIMPACSKSGAAARWAAAEVAAETISVPLGSFRESSTPLAGVATPHAPALPSGRPFARPSDLGWMPTMYTSSSHSLRWILAIRSVPMLPDPTIATFTLGMMTSHELDAYGTQSIVGGADDVAARHGLGLGE